MNVCMCVYLFIYLKQFLYATEMSNSSFNFAELT